MILYFTICLSNDSIIRALIIFTIIIILNNASSLQVNKEIKPEC